MCCYYYRGTIATTIAIAAIMIIIAIIIIIAIAAIIAIIANKMYFTPKNSPSGELMGVFYMYFHCRVSNN